MWPESRQRPGPSLCLGLLVTVRLVGQQLTWRHRGLPETRPNLRLADRRPSAPGPSGLQQEITRRKRVTRRIWYPLGYQILRAGQILHAKPAHPASRRTVRPRGSLRHRARPRHPRPFRECAALPERVGRKAHSLNFAEAWHAAGGVSDWYEAAEVWTVRWQRRRWREPRRVAPDAANRQGAAGGRERTGSAGRGQLAWEGSRGRKGLRLGWNGGVPAGVNVSGGKGFLGGLGVLGRSGRFIVRRCSSEPGSGRDRAGWNLYPTGGGRARGGRVRVTR
jgi:hypothetical protein